MRDRLETFKYVHVLHNNKFNTPIVDSINTHFSPDEHCFLFYGGLPESEFVIPAYANVFKICDLAVIPAGNTVEKYFFHGLYVLPVVDYLYQNRHVLSKSYWLTWGADLYEGARGKQHDFVRSNFKACAVDPYDEVAYRKWYGEKALLLPSNIYSPISRKAILEVTPSPKDYVRIQVNNSADYSTVLALKRLKKFKEYPVRVTTILSYGHKKWREKIIATGESIFGDRFEPILDYMPPEDYLQHLADVDIYILNQHRPQGITTAYTMLAMGRKVFMREEFCGYPYPAGIVLYASETLGSLSFEQLCSYPEREKNKELALIRFSEDHIRENWQRLFDA